VINIDNIKDLSFGIAIILNIDAKLIYNLLSRNLLLSQNLFELGVQFIILIRKFIDLLKRIKTSYSRNKLFFCYLAVTIDIYYTYPFFYLVRCLVRHHFLKSLLKLKYSDPLCTINIGCFVNLNWIDFSIPKNNT
jgi:hypothetical protein